MLILRYIHGIERISDFIIKILFMSRWYFQIQLSGGFGKNICTVPSIMALAILV